MKRVSLATIVLNLMIVSNAPGTQDQAVKQEGEQSQSNALAEITKLPAASTSAEEKSEKISLDPIITQAINFSNAIGDWFEDLFDKKQNMTFNKHVDTLEKIVDAMHKAIINPLVTEKKSDVIALAAYNLTAILYGRAKETYTALNNNKTSKNFWKITGALKKIDKKFKSEQEKTKLKDAFKDLTTQLIKSDSALCKKITQLEVVVAENSARTKKKGMWALGWGLRHRLQCK